MSDRPSSKICFTCFSNAISVWAGHPATFLLAIGAVMVWGITGPIFDFNDTWQLVINTGTSIVTFLMVFLIQNSQNRDSRSMQIKLDELIRTNEKAHKLLLDIEELDDVELQKIQNKYAKLAAEDRKKQKNGENSAECPHISLD